MTTAEFGSFTLVLLLILAAAHLFGYIFQRLRQPRVWAKLWPEF
jgi:Kef-type K+ transport system membrane component KefB